MYFNARSLRNKLHELHDVLSGASGNYYDVICVSETWLNESIIDQTVVAGYPYNVFRCDRINRLGGGCAIFVSQLLCAKHVTISINLPLSHLQAVCVEITHESHSFAVCCIYNPPGYLQLCIDALSDLIKYVCEKFPSVCFIGDFNMPDYVHNAFSHTRYQNFVNSVVAFGLDQLVRDPTRQHNFLDLIFCSDYLKCSKVVSLPPFCDSDHSSLTFNTFVVKSKCKAQSVTYRPDFNKCDFSQFGVYLNAVDWQHILTNDITVDGMWDFVADVIQDGVNQFVPLKKIDTCVKFKKYKYPPNIIKLQLQKKQSWSKRHEIGGMAVYYFWQYKCKSAIAKYHARREKNLLRLNQRNFFKYLNNRLNSTKNIIPPMTGENGCIHSDDEQKAEYFLNEFKKSFTDDDGTLPPCSKTNLKFNVNSIDFTPEIILKYLTKLNSQSAAGPDGLPGIFWKSLKNSLCYPLSILFTKSYCDGVLPSLWKKSIVTPVFKKGDPTLYCNYRPISLTCIACKVMEAIIRDKMINYLEINNLITAHQHGFLKKHSTGTQLLECVNDWTSAVEMGQCVDVCYIDFSRAFDSVSIQKLLYKLNSFGFEGFLLTWLSSLLLNRTFCVRVNNSISDVAIQTSGIAQGSVLGTLCFIIYINDLPSCVLYSTVKLYADDVKVFHKFSPLKITDNLQSDLDAISIWAKIWQLKISIEKTFMLHIGSKNTRKMYNINGICIAVKESIKDLGVYFSSDLSPQMHCFETAKRANRIANAILHSFVCSDVNTYMRAFLAYVRPILEYCCYIWYPSLCRDIDILENVLKCYTRRVFKKCKLPYMCYTDRLNYLNMQTIEYRRLVLSLTMFYNVYHENVSCNVLSNQIFNCISENLRGNSCRMFIPFCKSSVRKSFFAFKMLPIWNSLPNVIVTSNVSRGFMFRLNDCDLNRYLRLNV